MQTIFPILRYNDAREANRGLGSAFGFVQLFSVPGSGPYVRHAQLKRGRNLVMAGSVRPDDGIARPMTLGSSTQMLAVYVENPDEHFQRAQAAGAKILIRRRLQTSDRGSITSSIWKGIPDIWQVSAIS